MTPSASLLSSLPPPRLGRIAAAPDRRSSPASAGGEPAEAGFTELFAPLVWRRWLVLGCMIAGIGMAAVIALTSEREYAATAKLLVGNEAGNASRLAEARLGLEEQVQLLQGRDLAERVIAELDLAANPAFAAETNSSPSMLEGLTDAVLALAGRLPLLQPQVEAWRAAGDAAESGQAALDEHRAHAKLLQRFAERLSVEQQGTSSVLAVSFRANAPDLAAAVANALVEAHIAAQLEGGQSAMTGVSAVLETQLERLEADVRAAEAAVADYREAAGLGTDAATAERLAVLEQRRLDNRTEMVVQRERMARLLERQRSGNRAALVAELEDTASMQRLMAEAAALQQQLSQLGVTYGERHPSMLALREEQASVSLRIDAEIRRQMALEQADLARLESADEALGALISDLEDRLDAGDRAGIGLAGLERRAAAARALQESFLRDSLAVAAERALVRPSLKLLQTAAPPVEPAAPHTKVLLILGAIAGGMAGAVAAHVLEFRANALRSTREVARLSHAPVLAEIPRIRRRRTLLTPVDHVRERPRSVVADRLNRALIAALAGLHPEPGVGRVVLVTSSQPGEGKSTVALSLALLAAASGEETLFLDADLRRSVFSSDPSLEQRLALQELSAGGSSGCRLLIEQRSQLRLLTGLAGPNDDPHRVLKTGKMLDVLGELRRRFDLIVIDTPPLLAVSDAHHLMPLADGVILVSRLGRTARDDLREAIAQLDLAHASLLGHVVIDDATAPASAAAYYAE